MKHNSRMERSSEFAVKYTTNEPEISSILDDQGPTQAKQDANVGNILVEENGDGPASPTEEVHVMKYDETFGAENLLKENILDNQRNEKINLEPKTTRSILSNPSSISAGRSG